jgi:hypothetical protein
MPDGAEAIVRRASRMRKAPSRTDHNAAVMAVLFVVFGVKLVGDGIGVLV